MKIAQTKQDMANKKVRQTIFNEVAEFDYSDFIMFGSGRGDGIYPRYVGFDKNRQVVKLIIDFIRLTDKTDHIQTTKL